MGLTVQAVSSPDGDSTGRSTLPGILRWVPPEPDDNAFLLRPVIQFSFHRNALLDAVGVSMGCDHLDGFGVYGRAALRLPYEEKKKK